MTDPIPPAPTLRVHFGAETSQLTGDAGGVDLQLALPWLAGPNEETILASAGGKAREEEGFWVLQDGEKLAGATLFPAEGHLMERVRLAYESLFRLSRGFHLWRIWAYIPRLNAVELGLERYRQFNMGRWQAYEEHFGGSLASLLPAASAVGAARGRHLALVFLAGRSAPVHLENPLQVPAHAYPSQYGPRPPGFARASLVPEVPPGGATGWLSGTASIVGHETVGTGDIAAQLEVTWHNITRMQAAMQERSPSPAAAARMDYKVYLRDRADLDQVQAFLKSRNVDGDKTLFLEADICRADLALEIEGVFQAPVPG